MSETKQTAIMSLAPQTLSEAMEMSKTMAVSDLLPPEFRAKPANVFVQIMAGRERGLDPMQSIAGFHVVKGKPVMSAELMAALVKRSAECEYLLLVESTDAIATYETRRRGDPRPTKMSYTVEEAKRAGTATPGSGWMKHPAAMCRARAVASLCRVVYPDLLLGICEESEAEEIKAQDRAAQVEQAAAAARGEPARAADAVVEAEVVRHVEPAASDFDRVRLMERIFAADTAEALRLLVPELQTAPAEHKDELRAAYSKRAAELAKPAVVEAEVVEPPAA